MKFIDANVFYCRYSHPSFDGYEEFSAPNLMTLEGMMYAISASLGNGPQIENWFVALKDDTGDPFDASATYAAPGFVEITGSYDEATRPAWNVGGAYVSESVVKIDNSGSWMEFNFNTSDTIHGLSVLGGGFDPNVKGDTAGGGTMYSLANFEELKNVTAGGKLEILYVAGGKNE